MPTSLKSSGIRDNHYCGSVGEFLKPHIQNGSRLSVVSAYFTIYAYEALKDWLDRIAHMHEKKDRNQGIRVKWKRGGVYRAQADMHQEL